MANARAALCGPFVPYSSFTPSTSRAVSRSQREASSLSPSLMLALSVAIALLLTPCVHAAGLGGVSHTPAREMRGAFWQQWTADADAALSRVDLFAGTVDTCTIVSGTLHISEVSSTGTKSLIHSQPITTTCVDAQLTHNTCVFAPACRQGAWLAWQQWEVVDAQGSQLYLPLTKGKSYTAQFSFSSSAGVAAAVQTSTTTGVTSSLTHVAPFNSFVVRLSFSQPGAAVDGTFHSVLLSSNSLVGNSDSSSSVFSSAAVSGTLLAVVSLVAVVLLFLVYRAVRKPSVASTTEPDTPLQSVTSTSQFSPAMRNRRYSASDVTVRYSTADIDVYDEEAVIGAPRRFSSSQSGITLPGRTPVDDDVFA